MIYYIPVPQITILNFQTNKTTLIKTKISKKKKEKKKHNQETSWHASDTNNK